LALTDWGMPQEASRAEAEVLRVATRQRHAMRRALLKEMERLPAASSLELLATWLNAEGVVSLRAVRRPGSGAGEFHLAGTLRRGPMSTPVAILFRRDGAPLTREHVIDVRGSLHHYGEAAAAWLITLGSARSGAREEASITGAAPVALYDGEALTCAMEQLSIGLTRHLVPMLSLDQDLLQALRGPAQPRRQARPSAPSEEEASPRRDDETEEADAATEEQGKRPRRRRRRKRGDEESGAASEQASTTDEASEVAASDEPSTDEASSVQASTDDASTDESEVAASTDEASTDEASTDEASTDEASTDEASTDEASTMRRPRMRRPRMRRPRMRRRPSRRLRMRSRPRSLRPSRRPRMRRRPRSWSTRRWWKNSLLTWSRQDAPWRLLARGDSVA